MTFLFCAGAGELEVVRQNGDVVLFVACQLLRAGTAWWWTRTKSGLYTGKRPVSYPGCYDACCGLEGHEPTWTISWARLLANQQTNNGLQYTYLLLLLLHGDGEGIRKGPAVARRIRPWLALARSPAPLTTRLAKARPRPRRAFRQGQARLLLPLVSSRLRQALLTTRLSPGLNHRALRKPSCLFYCSFLSIVSVTATNFYTRLAQSCAEYHSLKLALKRALAFAPFAKTNLTHQNG